MIYKLVISIILNYIRQGLVIIYKKNQINKKTKTKSTTLLSILLIIVYILIIYRLSVLYKFIYLTNKPG